MKNATLPQKLGILSVLSLIGSIYILLLKYSRVISKLNYISSTVVALQEVFKLILTLCVLIFSCGGLHSLLKLIKENVINDKRTTLLMAAPSCLYALQNNMVFLALANMNVPTQQVLYQLKIPFTALLCVVWLKKSLSFQQWMAVFMIFVGTAAIEYESAHNHVTKPAEPEQENREENVMVGMVAVVVASLCSAIAGVYFEKLLKRDESSIWIKNLQMYLWSTPVSLLAVAAHDMHQVTSKGFFHDYNILVLLLIVVSSVGGILISLVLLYTDNVTKTFSTSVSLLLSTFASCLLFECYLGFYFIIGLGLVSLAILIYAIPCRPADDHPEGHRGSDPRRSATHHDQPPPPPIPFNQF